MFFQSRWALSAAIFVALVFECSCTHDQLRVPAEGPPLTAARSVQLFSEKQVATLHFPAGIYPFYAEDNKGFYYGSPQPVIQQGARRSQSHHGGIFVSRKDPN